MTLRFVLEDDGRVSVHDEHGPVLTGEAGHVMRESADVLRRIGDTFDASPKPIDATIDELHRWSVRALGGGEA